MDAAVIVFAVCVLLCIAGHVAILRCVVRKGVTRADAGVPRPRFLVELVWAVIPMLVLAFVLTATWARLGRKQDTPPPVKLMEVAR